MCLHFYLFQMLVIIQLQELLNETDRKMAEAKDLFGDHGYKYRVIPNVTSAPCFKHRCMSNPFQINYKYLNCITSMI